MTLRYAGFMGMAGALAMSLTVANAARAREAVVVETPSESALESSSHLLLPNRRLLGSGLFTFGASHVPALVVAIESERAVDNHLYAPVVGPWLDLSQRNDDCGGECKGERVNRLLLVTSGVFQGIGALSVLGAFVFPEARGGVTIASSERQAAVSLTIMPTQVKSGSGLVAMGKF